MTTFGQVLELSHSIVRSRKGVPSSRPRLPPRSRQIHEYIENLGQRRGARLNVIVRVNMDRCLESVLS